MRSSRCSARIALVVAALGPTFAIGDTSGLRSEASNGKAVQVATAGARVMSGLSIRKLYDLEFGEVRAPDLGGSVTVRPVANAVSERTSRGGVFPSGTNYAAAQFSVSQASGDPPRIEVMLPSRVTLNRVGGGETLTVDSFVSTVVTGCPNGACPAYVAVGATLRIPNAATSGRYVGTFSVTVNEF